jgi:4a-hydroxytetrahydrobiopterin dehydratase
VEDWPIEDKALTRSFQFKDFVEALAFVNKLGALAERENHHPDIHISWNTVTVRWWTHTAGGVTPRDRELAEATDLLL